MIFAVAIAVIVADFTTWIELDVATIYGLPLVLGGATRSRVLLWTLTGLLIAVTFVVYALQVPEGSFSLAETFFVNRVLNAVSLLLLAGLLHLWMRSAAIGEAQAELIKEQNEKLQAAKASRRMVEVQEAERRALASQLHDLVGQKLTALSINLTIAKSQLAPGQAVQIGARLDDSLKMVEETAQSIRDVMAELRPAVLDDFGLAPVLRWYAEEFTKRTGVATSVVEEGRVRRLTPTAEHALFRMAQNALANVAKHARADKAVLTLRTTPQSICMTVADNGDGFDPTTVHQPARDHGWGLMIMRERAAAVGAHLKVDSAPGHGTRVIVTINGDARDQSPARG
ncbi:sensor histidine kinase [Azoarcus sp. PA01]|nr:sensor histidine kinase [Azoarcus sp. PA01]KAI5913737.1 sensor histidine kinase [Azoarcus sp. PA01]